eukprot:scpid12208/ scgid33211/ 
MIVLLGGLEYTLLAVERSSIGVSSIEVPGEERSATCMKRPCAIIFLITSGQSAPFNSDVVRISLEGLRSWTVPTTQTHTTLLVKTWAKSAKKSPLERHFALYKLYFIATKLSNV